MIKYFNTVITSFKTHKWLRAYLFIVFLGSLVMLFDCNTQLTTMYGDMGTYIPQAMSWAFDGDNIFDQNDLERFCETVSANGPGGLFLNEHNNIYYYSKPMLYGIIISPLVKLLGINGILVANVLMFVGMIFLIAYYLKQYNTTKLSFIFTIPFFCCSLMLPYLFIAHADIFLAFMLCVLLFSLQQFKYYTERENKKLSQRWLYIMGILQGLCIYQRSPLIFFAAAIFFSLIIKKNYKQAYQFFLISLIPFIIFTFIQFSQTGSFSCYSGTRYYVSDILGGLNSSIDNLKLKKMSTDEMSIFSRITSTIRNPKSLIYNFMYYFIGRQTGIFIYAPFILCILIMIRTSLTKNYEILLGIIGFVFFFFFENPRNYFGGAQSFGNRYFLQIMPAFCFLLTTINIRKYTTTGLIASIGTCIFLGPVIVSPKTWVLNYPTFISERSVMQVFPLERTLQSTIIWDNKIQYDDKYINLENCYWPENGLSFWTYGDKTAKMYIESPTELNEIRLELAIGDQKEKQLINYPLTSKKEIVDRYFYTVKIDAVPKFWPQKTYGTEDQRALGVRVTLIDIH
ncbi:ArnT family glycosyltransferase [Hungatella hathewayi]